MSLVCISLQIKPPANRVMTPRQFREKKKEILVSALPSSFFIKTQNISQKTTDFNAENPHPPESEMPSHHTLSPLDSGGWGF